ncbi:hypothetical protein Pst134EA_014992 [Puccinia striiformis f. sp. tritici]|uniref:hypothetical protein n=1 Tax=Puccinia striiformis f. sp. tritici TaxID=168172 RepID=UPI0020088BDA|nr:hypothetical protein Pst134EA_019529 [Puccinia striiformis f. sp. tritici]XP_047804740.1 hypothetical protein Pst134EA_014992 [Puccinia striiformis f. sp. tritici]KAI9610591.1 hypothetical protein H4Q26_006736 [Puccinia striiformis f. sp. tritici PST-130]KAH9459377.1 hypothetical protein Pst134EA_019529 [Puccinia striiformis f. sp. tritici]KAH9462904.1 hypothetical protein Pst134EA_014992 [Puccinia striiformis f. sp. tritici]KAI9614293.1 hypothetical protein H4Q26_009436 [Puccinia striiform
MQIAQPDTARNLHKLVPAGTYRPLGEDSFKVRIHCQCTYPDYEAKLLETKDYPAFAPKSLEDTDSFCGYSVWKIFKDELKRNHHISKDLVLERFLDLQFLDFSAKVITDTLC